MSIEHTPKVSHAQIITLVVDAREVPIILALFHLDKVRHDGVKLDSRASAMQNDAHGDTRIPS